MPRCHDGVTPWPWLDPLHRWELPRVDTSYRLDWGHTHLAWIDARELGVPDPTRFFEDAGVGLSDGAAFGAPGFVRLDFGCPRSQLERALARMEAAV